MGGGRGGGGGRARLGGADLTLPPPPRPFQFLDGFYLSRIGIRILIGQHIALHEPPREGFIGLISTRCSPVRVARDAIDDARAMCAREYGGAPAVDVYGDPDFT